MAKSQFRKLKNGVYIPKSTVKFPKIKLIEPKPLKFKFPKFKIPK